jgi:hypothetical protein
MAHVSVGLVSYCGLTDNARPTCNVRPPSLGVASTSAASDFGIIILLRQSLDQLLRNRAAPRIRITRSIADSVSDESARQSLDGTSIRSRISPTGQMSITTGLTSAYYPTPASSARGSLDKQHIVSATTKPGSGPPTSDDGPIISTTDIARTEGVRS